MQLLGWGLLVRGEFHRNLDYLLDYIVVVGDESHDLHILEVPALAHVDGPFGCGSVAAEGHRISTHREYLRAEHIVVDVILIG